MAMMLTTIKVLSQVREQLKGTVYCCFEEGEEALDGYQHILELVSEYPIDDCFALHVYNDMPAGKINLVSGPRMAGAVCFGVHVIGKSGHGSRPDLAKNPVIPASHIVCELDSALQNQMNAEETLTFSICVQKAGEIWNAIPDEAFFSGTSRYFSRPAGEKVLALIKKTCTNVADVHGCRVEFEPYTKVLMEPVINDQEVVGETAQKLTQMCGPQVLGEHGLWFASETFCKYLNKYPGALGFLGIANPDLGSGAAHHNSRFDVDESALLLGVCAELSFALR